MGNTPLARSTSRLLILSILITQFSIAPLAATPNEATPENTSVVGEIYDDITSEHHHLINGGILSGGSLLLWWVVSRGTYYHPASLRSNLGALRNYRQQLESGGKCAAFTTRLTTASNQMVAGFAKSKTGYDFIIPYLPPELALKIQKAKRGQEAIPEGVPKDIENPLEGLVLAKKTYEAFYVFAKEQIGGPKESEWGPLSKALGERPKLPPAPEDLMEKNIRQNDGESFFNFLRAQRAMEEFMGHLVAGENRILELLGEHPSQTSKWGKASATFYQNRRRLFSALIIILMAGGIWWNTDNALEHERNRADNKLVDKVSGQDPVQFNNQQLNIPSIGLAAEVEAIWQEERRTNPDFSIPLPPQLRLTPDPENPGAVNVPNNVRRIGELWEQSYQHIRNIPKGQRPKNIESAVVKEFWKRFFDYAATVSPEIKKMPTHDQSRFGVEIIGRQTLIDRFSEQTGKALPKLLKEYKKLIKRK